MAEDDLPRPIAHQRDGGAPGIVVGEVAAAAEDALLERVGVRPGAQHIRVIVGFQHHGVRAGGDVQPTVAHTADVRGHAEARRAQRKTVAHGLSGVVGDVEGHDAHAAEEKVLHRLDHAHVLRRHAAELFLHGHPCALRGVNGQVEAARQHAHAANVVDVFMGDEQAGELPRLNADPAQFGDYARAGNARVDEQMSAVATRVDAVAAGAAEERRKAKFQ